jgi:hypothetical protein
MIRWSVSGFSGCAEPVRHGLGHLMLQNTL